MGPHISFACSVVAARVRAGRIGCCESAMGGGNGDKESVRWDGGE